MIYYVDQRDEFKEAMNFIKIRGIMAVDTETTGIDPLTSELLMIQIGNGSNQYVFDYQRLLRAGETFLELKEWLENKEKIKIFHNAKFDYKFLKHHLKCHINNILCTFVIEHALKKGIRQRGFNLAEVADRYVNADLEKSTRQTFGRHEIGQDFTEEQIRYAAQDVEHLIDIYKQQLELIEKRGIHDLISLECNAIAPTGDMELNGTYVNRTRWLNLFKIASNDRQKAKEAFFEEIKETIPKIQEALRQEAIEKSLEKGLADQEKTKKHQNQNTFDFFKMSEDQMRRSLERQFASSDQYTINIDSPVQIQKVLSLHLNTEITTTGEEKLKILNEPVADKLIAYRKASKLCTTYGEEFLRKAVHPVTKRIHTNFNQTKAESGRYSSSDPVNLQNIPSAAEYRAAFTVQHPDWRMICCDYASCELRILAEISQEPAWINAYKQGLDMHSMVASMMFGIPYEEIVDENNEVRGEYKDLRTRAKAIGFGVAYGMKAGRLANTLKIEIDEASDLLNKFWKAFPEIKKTLDRVAKEAIQQEYAESPLDKRRRYFKSFDLEVKKERAHAENIAKNMICQAPNASMIKKALCLLRSATIARGWESDIFRILMVIHDEIVCECHMSIVDEAKQLVENMMVEAAEYYVKSVPMKAEAKIDLHWVH